MIIELNMNILIFGCGQLGSALAIKLSEMGHSVSVVSRSKKILPENIHQMIQNIHHLDLSQNKILFDWVYVILSPDERTPSAYRQAFIETIQPITENLKHHPIEKIVFISSTRVYGENQGEMVNDETPVYPADEYGKILREAELNWQALWDKRLLILRPSGLYSGESLRLKEMALNLNKIESLHYMNRIHYDKVVEIMALLTTINMNQMAESYILNEKALLQHEFLNEIRIKNGLNPMVPNGHLPITGKQLISNGLRDLFPHLFE